MKTPITSQESVVIYCFEHESRSRFVARTEDRKLKAESTGGKSAAAWNLACRFFFGGNTKAFIGEEERKAIQVTARGSSGNVFVAWLVKPASEAA